MARQDTEDGWDDDGPEEDDINDADADLVDDDDKEADTVECPRCGASVYEQAERCPRCGEYIEDAKTSRRFPRWVVVTVIVCIVLVLLWQL